MAERSVKVVLDATISGYVSKMHQAEAATMSLANKGLAAAGKHEQGLRKLSNAAGAVGLGLTAVAVLAVKSAIDWESAWAGVTKTVSGTPQQLARVEAGLRGLVKTMPESHTQIAAVAEAAGQLGVKTGAIVEFTKNMVMLGDTTNLTADEAATSIAQLMNVMQTAPGDVDNLSSTLVALGNAGASTERDIVQMAQRIAGAGTIVGLSEAEVLSLSNALASTGINAEAGGTAVSSVLIDISKAVATNSDKLSTWAEVAGMSSEQFVAAWKDKPAAALTSVVEGFDRMNKSGGDVFSTLETLGQDGIRTTSALLNLANGGDILRKSFEDGKAAWEGNTALLAEAAKRYDTTAARSEIAMNGIKDNAIDAGQALLPAVAKIADSISGLTGAFGSMPGPVKSGMGALVGVGGIALLTTAGLIKAAVAVNTLRDSFQSLSLSGGKAGGVIGAVGKAGVVFAALAATMAVGEAVTKRSGKEVDGLAKDLDRLGKSGKATGQLVDIFGKGLGGKDNKFARDVRSIGGALKEFDKFGDDNFMTRLGRRTVGQGFLGGGAGNIYATAEGIRDIDAAFVKLSKNDPESAIKAFTELRDRTLETGGSVEELGRAFPSMTELMRASSDATGGASDATEVLAGDMKKLAPMAEEAAKAMAAAEQSTRDSAMSFYDMGAGLDSASYSFKGWIKTLHEAAEAQADWADNLILATNRGVDEGVIDKLEAMGPAGAKALDDLAHASDRDIAKINEDFRSAEATADNLADVLNRLPSEAITSFKSHGAKDAIRTAADVAHKYNLTPAEVRTILKALNYTKPQIAAVLKALRNLDGTTANPQIRVLSNADAMARAAKRSLDAINGHSVSMNIKVLGGTQLANADGNIYAAFANGTENHTAQIGNGAISRVWNEPETGGEAYIPLHPSKRDRSMDIWRKTGELLGAQHFANGGTIGGMATASIMAMPLATIYALLNSGRLTLEGNAQAAETRNDLFTNKATGLDVLQQRAQIRDLQSSLNKRGKGSLKGLDRSIAKAELVAAKRELAEIRKSIKDAAGITFGSEAAEAARLEKAQAMFAAAKGIRDTANLESSTMRSPKSVDRYLTKMIGNIGAFTNILAKLKTAGAAPWLLNQLMQAGPTDTAIRLGNQYLNDTEALKALNAKAGLLDAVSTSYGQLTSDERFAMPGAYAAAGVSKAIDIQIQALDISQITSEIVRQVRHELNTTAAGGGI